MIVPYETIPLLEADKAQLAEFFGRMINDGLPGFVVRNAAPDSYQLFKDIEAVLEGPVYKRNEEHAQPMFFERTVEGTNEDADELLHVDERPTPNLLASKITTHHTSDGRVVASFFELSNATKYFYQQGHRTGSMLAAHKLFLEGLVDDEELKPHGYVCEINAGDMVAFRLSGENPLAHIFQSVDLPRRSTAIDFYKPQTIGELLLAEKAS